MSESQIITMSTLGKNGRFGNQIFQYAFLKIYAKEHHLRVETPEWIGQYLFGHKDPGISRELPVVVEKTNDLEKAYIPGVKEPFKNVDFWGYFQYHTQYYADNKDYFTSLFIPGKDLLIKMQVGCDRLRSRGKTIVGLHLRRGDYGYGSYFVAPSEWYKEWLVDLWKTLDEPVLFIASDEVDKVLNDFADYNPVTVKDLDINLPEADFYPDFYLLSQCDIVAISNSSFSFAACMLNEKATLFVRPQLEAKKLIPFDPWNSKPILEEQAFFITPTEYLEILGTCIHQYQQEKTYADALANIRLLRQQVAKQCVNLSKEKLEINYVHKLGKIYQMLANSGIKNEALIETESPFVSELIAEVAKGFTQPKAINYLLAAMLYCRAYQLPLSCEASAIPQWLLNDYWQFIFEFPHYFQEIGEVNRYYQHMQKWVDYLYQNILDNPHIKIWQNVALVFAKSANFIPLYFVSENLIDIYTKRSKIIEFVLKSRRYPINYQFPTRPESRQKIRLGILNAHFGTQTETFTTLPVFEHLNRHQFEIILYSNSVDNSPLEQYCKSRADQLVKLPSDFVSQVDKIRADDLDILLIGTNVTALTHNITLLAMHRLARIQVTSVSSPVTTGIRNIDYYISGQLAETLQNANQNYCEHLITIDGSPHCFNYTVYPEIVKIKHDRKTLGISEKAVVFVSGANFYKIIPELRETWAKIIASVPDSVLVLYPFGSAWSNAYAKMPFINNMRAIFAKYEIHPSRLVILDALPSRADVKECLKLADVYLDSIPYTGANSTVDALEVELPTIVMDADSFRFKQAAALLRELGIPDLIVESEEAYINLAVTLGTNSALRQHYREQIRQKMQMKPKFLDSRSYGEQMGVVFQNLFQEWLKLNSTNYVIEFSKNLANQRLKHPVDSPEFLNQLAGCVNLYEIDPSDTAVLEELREIRQKIAEFWLSVEAEKLDSLYAGSVGKAHQALIKSGIKHESLTETEKTFVDELVAHLAQESDDLKVMNYRLAAMLYCDLPND